MSRYIPRLGEHKGSACTLYFCGVYSDRLVRRNPEATKELTCALLRRFARGIKFIFRQFTLVITRPKRSRKPFQTSALKSIRQAVRIFTARPQISSFILLNLWKDQVPGSFVKEMLFSTRNAPHAYINFLFLFFFLIR